MIPGEGPVAALSLLAQGFALGFSIAAPVGPIGLLCIRRALAEGRSAGLASGLGAATADALYGSVAAFGLNALSGFLVGHQGELRFAGGALLLYLGARAFFAAPARHAAPSRARGLVGSYLSTFALTLTNPVTILAFVAAFAGLGLAGTSGDPGRAAALVIGVFLGSAAWWAVLSGGVSLLRDRFSARLMTWVHRASGILIAGFGVAALIGLLV